MGCISDLTGYSTHTCVRTSVLVMYAIAMGRSSVPRSIATTVACEGVQADPPALLPVGIMLVGRHTQRRPRVFTATSLGKAARRMPVPLTARLAACAALCRHMGGGCRCVAPTNLRGDVVAGRNVAGTSTQRASTGHIPGEGSGKDAARTHEAGEAWVARSTKRAAGAACR